MERTYNLPHSLQAKTQIAIKEILEKGYIKESKSSWVNNIRPVEKKDGTVRIINNFIALNKLVELDGYSLPNMDMLLYSLRGAAWFTKLDLKDGGFPNPN